MTGFLLLLLPFLSEAKDFKSLVIETNSLLKTYDTLNPFSDDNIPLKQLGMDRKSLQDFNKEYEVEKSASDSVDMGTVILFMQNKIVNNIYDILQHPDFIKHDIDTLIKSESLNIIQSPDRKLFNFSLDEKTGGSYRSKISIMHYSGFESVADSATIADAYSHFMQDGYDAIDTINYESNVLYVLTGSTRGCSYCFLTHVTLIQFESEKFTELFHYAVDLRTWEKGVTYDSKNKIVMVDYVTDDLTPYCNCNSTAGKQAEGDEGAEMKVELEDPKLHQPCNCLFRFSEGNFKMIQ